MMDQAPVSTIAIRAPSDDALDELPGAYPGDEGVPLVTGEAQDGPVGLLGVTNGDATVIDRRHLHT
jgi:hypothetical protein